VLSRVAKFCVLVLLIISIGGHWALLQSAAWVGMMIDYSRDGSISAAVCKTFDGKHPCCLCKAIAAGKKSEQKKELSFKSQKLEFPPSKEDRSPLAPGDYQLFAQIDFLAQSAFQKPPTPPPRDLTL
jgi:hypothetical protein